FDSLVVFRTISVRVEMAGTIVANVLEEFDQPECGAGGGRAESQVLIVTPGYLVVQVDVKQLTRFPRLCHCVRHVESRHMLVRDLGIDPDDIRMIQGRYEAQV